jgi:hypothetical protein
MCKSLKIIFGPVCTSKSQHDSKIYQFRVSSLGLEELVNLLLCANANPTLKGLDGKTPYDVSKNKNIRNIFRKFAGTNPLTWNWESAGIPPLTDDLEKEVELKKVEKRKKKRANQAEKQKQKKQEV